MPDFFGEHTSQSRTESKLVAQEEGDIADALKLELDDEDFVEVMNQRIKDSRAFFSKRDLYKRREKNEQYWLGQQVQQMLKAGVLKPHHARYQDNIIFEAEGTLKAIAVSRVPDLIVTPGNDTDESREIADNLTNVINNRIRKRENRIVLGRAYVHRPIYFVGVMKARWDSEKGRLGDYVFESIHPSNLDVDHTATSNDTNEMDWMTEHYDLTVKEILMRWPNKKKELMEELKWSPDDIENEKKLATKLKIAEIWFTWYKKEGEEWVRLEGTAWKYKDVVFDKIKNPYWDWEGETTMFTFDTETGKKPLEEADVRESLISGQPIQGLRTERVYHNHVRNPRKPYFLMGYKQLGMQPYDETTRIEQGIYLQDNINIRGKQITMLAASAKGKNVFSTDSGMTEQDVEEYDQDNPDQDLLIDGPLSDVHAFIPGTPPNAALFQDQEINRGRLFSKEGVNAALRGERGGETTATQTQLFKESDFTRIDDEVEATINPAGEWMAEWALQFIKLFYTEEHLERLVGKDGETVFQKLDRDLIEDGMEVEVSASSVDKLRRRSEAFDLAGINMIDPVSFYRDIEATDPEGRAEKLMLFNTSPALYFQKFVEGNETTEEQVDELTGLPVQGPPESPEVQAITQATELPEEIPT